MAGRTILAMVALLGVLGSCGGSPPTGPSTSGYAGQWSGAVVQGGSVSFTVSPEQRVTSITVNCSLSGCSGSTTFDGLALDIATLQRPPENPGVGPFDNPRFACTSGGPQGTNSISLTGAFPSSGTATGVTIYNDFRGCGSGLATWNATRR